MAGSGSAWLLLAARIAAVLGIAVLSAFFFGEGLFGDDPWPPEFTPIEGLLFAFFPIGAGIGLIVGLLWPRTGGAITVLSLVAFYAVFLVDRGEMPQGPYFVLFTMGGPLLLIAGWMRARDSRQPPAT